MKKKRTEEVEGTPLKGEELLSKLDELSTNALTEEEKSIACGYQGNVRLFRKAVLMALGLGGEKRVLRPLRVSKQGSIIIGRVRTEMAGFVPGQKVFLRISKGRIIIEGDQTKE